MVDAETERREAIRSAILSYLERHPRASDALAGICAWWLPESGVRETGRVVEEVIDELVAAHRLRRVKLADGTLIYRSAGGDERG